ncbi:hypothetical protein HKD37_18G050175 [Glycine soja]
MMNSVIKILYFNGRVYEEIDGVIFEGSKKTIQIKRGISFNALKKKLEIRFLVSGKYVALQICDDKDVETMIESFHQQDQMSVLELYIEKDVASDSMFHYANSLTSCGNNLSNNEAEPPRNVSNLHGDEDDDDDYLVEESLDEDDSVGGVEQIQNPFWNDALHYNNINLSLPDEEDICGLEMPSSFNVGQELHVGMDFNSKDAIKNALKQYVMKVHQSFKLSPAIATWIDRISKEKWTMAYDKEGRRYGHMTTNLLECINKVLKDCRNIPITTLVKSTYSRCRKYFIDRGRQAQRQLNEG